MRRKALLYAIIIFLLLLLSYSVFLYVPDRDIISLTKEDNFFEMATAIFFFIASVFLILSFFKSKQGNNFCLFKTQRNLFLILFAVLFFVGFGEEISWGQRILGVKTPDALAEINLQKETNIHNLSMLKRSEKAMGITLSISRVSLLFILWGFGLPLLNIFKSPISRWFSTINIPIAPLYIGIFFPINYCLSVIARIFTHPSMGHSVVEIKECDFGLLFLVFGVWFFLENRNKNRAENQQHKV